MPKEYLASQGAVWDWISFKQYGDERFIDLLLKANPAVRHIVQFEKPTLIQIPDMPEVPAESNSMLPPWKQAV